MRTRCSDHLISRLVNETRRNKAYKNSASELRSSPFVVVECLDAGSGVMDRVGRISSRAWRAWIMRGRGWGGSSRELNLTFLQSLPTCSLERTLESHPPWPSLALNPVTSLVPFPSLRPHPLKARSVRLCSRLCTTVEESTACTSD